MKHKSFKEQNFPKQLFLYAKDTTAFYRFLADLPGEVQHKILTKLGELKYTHKESLREPYFKCFTQKRYKGFIELRIRSKMLVRIIFIPHGNDYIILNFFVKTCPRDTDIALEKSERVKKRLAQTPHAQVELVPGDTYYELNAPDSPTP